MGRRERLADAEVFPYSRGEWQKMFADLRLLMLAALDSAIALVGNGSFAQIRAQFEE